MPKVAVIGLGRFGIALARGLSASGAQVIAIDRTAHLVDDVKDDVDVAVRLDATDEHALASQEIEKVDVCVVAIGENFEAALLTTVIATQLGVPKIICRAQSGFHAQIFRQIGADEIIEPEVQAAEHWARKLANPQLDDVVMLAENYTLIELRAPSAFCGKTLKDLGLRTKYHVNLVAIKRTVPAEAEIQADETETEVSAPQYIMSVPKPDDVIQPDDLLVIVGSDEALAKLPKE